MTFGHIYNVQTGYQAKYGPFNVLAELYFIVALIRGPLGINCHTGTTCSSGSWYHSYSRAMGILLHRDKISLQSWPKSMGTKCHRLLDKLLRRVEVPHFDKSSNYLGQNVSFGAGIQYVHFKLEWHSEHCHSRRFTGRMLRLGRNVTCSFRGWTDRQCNLPVTVLKIKVFNLFIFNCSVQLYIDLSWKKRFCFTFYNSTIHFQWESDISFLMRCFWKKSKQSW